MFEDWGLLCSKRDFYYLDAQSRQCDQSRVANYKRGIGYTHCDNIAQPLHKSIHNFIFKKKDIVLGQLRGFGECLISLAILEFQMVYEFWKQYWQH